MIGGGSGNDGVISMLRGFTDSDTHKELRLSVRLELIS